MKKFPLFSSIDPILLSNESRQGNIHLLRNKILQSDSLLKFSGWTLGGFLNSLGRGKIPFKSKYFCVLCLSIYCESNTAYVYLESGEKLSLIDVIRKTIDSKYPLIILFAYCKQTEIAIIQKEIVSDYFQNLYSVISYNDSKKFLFALACELANWWELASSKFYDVTFSHILSCIISIIENYRKFTSINSFECISINPVASIQGIAWNGGNNYCRETDIDKITNNARKEQIADTIKRIFDNANHPRDEHLEPEQRLIASQGLFWLAENADSNDVENWIIDTRFYSDISIEKDSHKLVINLTFKANLDEIFFSQVFKDFMTIPAGQYEFGVKENYENSEPTANLFYCFLESFKILKYPVTKELWSKVVDDQTEPSKLPLVDVNYFEALRFAEELERIFHKLYPNQFLNLRITIPSEYQWEATARGIVSNTYPWGNKFHENLCNCEMNVGAITPVGQYSPLGDSAFGCQDMAGNVREWTRSYGGTKGIDWQMHSPNSLPETAFTIVPSSRMIIKGGSYSYSSECVVGWMRNTQIASRKDSQTGFRLVIETKSNE